MKRLVSVLVVLAGALALKVVSVAQEPASPTFDAAGALVLPKDYREWVFVGSGLGMDYGPQRRAANEPPMFDNIYVTRNAYRAFMQSGRWPEQTMFIMEGRASQTNQLLANVGQTQGEAHFVEGSVKDSRRFPDTTWGYFNFGDANSPRPSAKQLATSRDCYTCHGQNTAVENTFVQFYPALLQVAKKFNTIKPTFDPLKKF
jgi:hypothetical protein